MTFRNVVSIRDFEQFDLLRFFKRVREYKMTRIPLRVPLAGRILGSLYYEPSTRTRFSFEAAMIRLGGHVISTENAKDFSSAAKGETLEDSIDVISNYCDIITLRHPENGAAERALAHTSVPLINAGDGSNEHPTQALLDLYTIWEAIQKGLLPNDGLAVLFYGDNDMSRAVHSFCRMIARYNKPLGLKVDMVCFGGRSRALNHVVGELAAECVKADMSVANHGSDLLTREMNVVYLTRLQQERYPAEGAPASSDETKVFRRIHASRMPERSIIMHPLPRMKELAIEVDADHRAWYFEQAKNGLYVRMALLEALLA